MPEYTVGVAGSVASTTATPGGAAGGDLSGTYPNPSVATAALSAINGTGLTKGDILAASGTNAVGTIALGASGNSSGMLTVGPSGLPVYSNIRERIGQIARTVLAEPFHPAAAAAATTPTANSASGSLNACLVGLRAGDTVTNIIVPIGTNGTLVTFFKAALYNSTGGFIVATASVSATANTGQGVANVIPLTSAYSVTADGGYYIGVLQYGTAGAALTRGNNSASLCAAVGSGVRPFMAVNNQTDMAGDVTPGTLNAAIYLACN